jgi:hypothetical protein
MPIRLKEEEEERKNNFRHQLIILIRKLEGI